MKSTLTVILLSAIYLITPLISASQERLPKIKTVRITGAGEGHIITETDYSLIGNETQLIIGKTRAIITCDNELTANKIHSAWGKYIIHKQYQTLEDKKGKYIRSEFVLNQNDAKRFIEWAKTNL